MNTLQPTGAHMDDKVSVNINEIDNGFVFRRSWQEEGKEKNDYKYCSEEYFMKKLPPPLDKLFKKGYMKDMEKKDSWDDLREEKIDYKEEDE